MLPIDEEEDHMSSYSNNIYKNISMIGRLKGKRETCLGRVLFPFSFLVMRLGIHFSFLLYNSEFTFTFL